MSRDTRPRRVRATILCVLLAMASSGLDSIGHAVQVGAGREIAASVASVKALTADTGGRLAVVPGAAGHSASAHHDLASCGLCAALLVPAPAHPAARLQADLSLVTVRSSVSAPARAPALGERWSSLVPRAPPVA